MGFTKLFSSIVTSTIWSEDHATVRVWIAMLAMSDAHGNVDGSIPGFAHIARVTREEMIHALETLTSPDPDSRTADHEGRRIETIQGGWRILNYLRYREEAQAKEGSRAAYMRDFRKKKSLHPNVTRNIEAEAEREGDVESTSKPSVGHEPAAPVLPLLDLGSENGVKGQHQDTRQGGDVARKGGLEGGGREPDTLESKGSPFPSLSDTSAPHQVTTGWAAFWTAYPRKVGKHGALKAFKRLAPHADLLLTMLAALEVQKKQDGWTKDGGQFIPHPATWLNGRRWEDQVTGGGRGKAGNGFRNDGQDAAGAVVL